MKFNLLSIKQFFIIAAGILSLVGLPCTLNASATSEEEQAIKFQRFAVSKAIEISKEEDPKFNASNILSFIKRYQAQKASSAEITPQEDLADLFKAYGVFLSGVDRIFSHALKGYDENFLCITWKEAYRDYLQKNGGEHIPYLSQLHHDMYDLFSASGVVEKGVNPVLIQGQKFSRDLTSDVFIYRDEEGDFIAFPVPTQKAPDDLLVKNIGYGPRSLRTQGEYTFIFDDAGLVTRSGYLIQNNFGMLLEVKAYGASEEGLAFQNNETSALLPIGMKIATQLAEATDIATRGLNHVFIPMPSTYEEYQAFRYAMLLEIEAMIIEFNRSSYPSKTLQSTIDLLVNAFVDDKEEQDADEMQREVSDVTDALSTLSMSEVKSSSQIVPVSALSMDVQSMTERNQHYRHLIEHEKKTIAALLPAHRSDVETPKLNRKQIKMEKRQQKKLDKKKKIQARSETRRVPSQQASSSSSVILAPAEQVVTSVPRGAVKFRKLSKLIRQMAREAAPSDLKVIQDGSHLNFHSSGSASVTLVRPHGKLSHGISRFKGARILKNFKSYFEHALQQPSSF